MALLSTVDICLVEVAIYVCKLDLAVNSALIVEHTYRVASLCAVILYSVLNSYFLLHLQSSNTDILIP